MRDSAGLIVVLFTIQPKAVALPVWPPLREARKEEFPPHRAKNNDFSARPTCRPMAVNNSTMGPRLSLQHRR